MSNSYEIVMHTWGCKVNTYDTGLLEKRFENQGEAARISTSRSLALNSAVTGASPQQRVHVLNTCAVTEEASREAVRRVRQLKARDPQSKVVVTGCGAQVDGGMFDQLAGADLVVANSHKGDIETFIGKMMKGELQERVYRSNIFRKDALEDGGGLERDHTRAFLKVQDGCNSFCSYCVIPFARGKSRSIPASNLIARVNELHASGAGEIVLTGVHIADYEDDSLGTKIGLDDLVELILLKTTMPRIRISSLEPAELSDRLLSLYSNPRMCPHFHLSIQSACTATLQRMRRRYSAEDIENVFARIQSRLPNAFIGLDLIVGFPGESDAEFQETYERLSRLGWTRIHVFPYSERPGTKALALSDSVPNATRNSRAAFIRQLSADRYATRAQAAVGEKREGLILKRVKSTESENEIYHAITRDYWPVRIEGRLATGFEVPVLLEKYVKPVGGAMDGYFQGRPVP